jgi:hypothetical protein
MYFGARLYYRTKPVAPEDMDFKSDLAEIAADSYDEPPPKNRLEAFWQWLVSRAVPLDSVFDITNVISPVGVIIPPIIIPGAHQLYHLLLVSFRLPSDIPGCLLYVTTNSTNIIISSQLDHGPADQNATLHTIL